MSTYSEKNEREETRTSSSLNFFETPKAEEKKDEKKTEKKLVDLSMYMNLGGPRTPIPSPLRFKSRTPKDTQYDEIEECKCQECVSCKRDGIPSPHGSLTATAVLPLPLPSQSPPPPPPDSSPPRRRPDRGPKPSACDLITVIALVVLMVLTNFALKRCLSCEKQEYEKKMKEATSPTKDPRVFPGIQKVLLRVNENSKVNLHDLSKEETKCDDVKVDGNAECIALLEQELKKLDVNTNDLSQRIIGAPRQDSDIISYIDRVKEVYDLVYKIRERDRVILKTKFEITCPDSHDKEYATCRTDLIKKKQSFNLTVSEEIIYNEEKIHAMAENPVLMQSYGIPEETRGVILNMLHDFTKNPLEFQNVLVQKATDEFDPEGFMRHWNEAVVATQRVRDGGFLIGDMFTIIFPAWLGVVVAVLSRLLKAWNMIRHAFSTSQQHVNR